MTSKLQVVMVGGYTGDGGWISIGRYQRELTRCLKATDPDHSLEIIPVAPRPGMLLDGIASLGAPGRKTASYVSRFVVYPRQIPRPAGALYHLVDQSLSYLVGRLDPARTVITCHDLLHFPLWERMKKCFPWPWASDRLYRFCVGKLPRCAAVIAVSQRCKEDAVRYLGCDPARVHVIHEGVSPAFFQPPQPEQLEQIRRKWAIPPGPLLLHVGVTTYYKNIEGILVALAELRRRFSRSVTLLRMGPTLTPSQCRLADRLGIRQAIREVGIQGDDTLRAFNHLADSLVFPSHYEGFGFPPLEAMACGLPVVASNRGSLPEILGDAALLVDPDDPSAIADAIRRVLEDGGLRQQLRTKGLERSAQFRWEHCAEATLKVYQSLQDRSRGSTSCAES